MAGPGAERRGGEEPARLHSVSGATRREDQKRKVENRAILDIPRCDRGYASLPTSPSVGARCPGSEHRIKCRESPNPARPRRRRLSQGRGRKTWHKDRRVGGEPMRGAQSPGSSRSRIRERRVYVLRRVLAILAVLLLLALLVPRACQAIIGSGEDVGSGGDRGAKAPEKAAGAGAADGDEDATAEKAGAKDGD